MKNEIWEGCGHEVEPVFLSGGDVLSAVIAIEYMENNPKKLCFDCWLKEADVAEPSIDRLNSRLSRLRLYTRQLSGVEREADRQNGTAGTRGKK